MSDVLNEKPGADVLPRSSGASSLLNGRYLPPPEDKDGKLWVRTSVLVQAEAHKLYSMWRDLKSIPAWQEEMVSVTETGVNTSHWVMRHGDKTIEWDSTIEADEPGHRIVWRSIGGDVENAGEVIFEEAPGGRGTMITLLQEFKMGKIASAIATFTGRNPKQAVIENLRHFKALAETGEIPRTEPQPHGDRGTIGDMKKSMYGENIATPTGTTSTIN